MHEPPLIAAGAVADLPAGARRLVFVPGFEAVVVLNVDGDFLALENSCPHAGASMASGACSGYELTCPAHGLKFNVRNGQCTASPKMRVPTHAVAIRYGQLWLEQPADATVSAN